MADKIQDFGEKIGGAKKDLAALRKAMMDVDIATADKWTDAERAKYISKKELFPTPDYKGLYESGNYTREALFFIKKVYGEKIVKYRKQNHRNKCSNA